MRQEVYNAEPKIVSIEKSVNFFVLSVDISFKEIRFNLYILEPQIFVREKSIDFHEKVHIFRTNWNDHPIFDILLLPE